MVVHHPAAWAILILAILCAVLSIVLLRIRREHARDIYKQHFSRNVPRERLLFASVGFYIGFAGIRMLTHAIRAGRGPFHDVAMGGRHIHHSTLGIFGLHFSKDVWICLPKQVRLMGSTHSVDGGIASFDLRLPNGYQNPIV